MKKAITGLLILLCFVLVVSSLSKPVIITEPLPPKETVMPQKPDPSLPYDSDSRQETQDPAHRIPDKTDLFGAGSYIAGTSIPAGLYVAVSDGSGESKVTIREGYYADTDIPEIIVTSRFVPATGSFTDKPNYIEGVRRSGGIPVFPDDDPELAAILREGTAEYTDYADKLAERYDGLLLTGGGDIAAHFFNQDHHPAANQPDEILDEAELALCHAFIRAGKPVFGICRGMQILNVATGGELIQDIPAILGIPLNVHSGESARHNINIRPGTWLYSQFGPELETNSLHHQCVDGVSPGFTVVAYTGPVIEAMERGNLFGTQFHPERMLDEGMEPFFDDFIYRCSYRNIVIEYFTTHTIINIRENQYIDVKGAYLQSIESSSGIFDRVFNSHGFYADGMYLTGTHLPEGRYRLSATGDTMFSSYIIYNTLSHDSVQKSGSLTESDTLVVLSHGQYIKLINAVMTPG